MALISIEGLSIGFRGPPLLENATCQIERQQRIGLLGRNGAGKTTLMRIISGEIAPDHGVIRREDPLVISWLPQNVPADLEGTIREVVARKLEVVSHEEPWQQETRVEQTLSRMQLNPDEDVQKLSSGMKRRVLLAGAIVADPDLLLLDEPTNHLDIEAIEWLEAFLLKCRSTLLFVTHDRVFLRHIANRILEIDRGQLFDWSCDYGTFLQRKADALAAEDKQHSLFDKKLAEEEIWIRKGIKARRTRNEGRVRALIEMRKQHSQRRSSQGKVKLQIQEAERSGNLVAAIEDVSFGYDDQRILSHFSTTIMRGDKLGIVGRNGAGKTTLLKILLGKMPPQSGTVRLGTNLQIAYFDQLRQQLNENDTVQHAVADGYDNVQLNGQSKHVLGYLQDFLFSPERSRSEIRFLSGGERNRLLLAKLFAKPANIIVLDEPTNDLDAETLELLEERLMEFSGTVLLVSHDREFLNNVVTSCIAFEPGGVKEYVGGYDDWLRQRDPSAFSPKESTAKVSGAKKGGAKSSLPNSSETGKGPSPASEFDAHAVAVSQAPASKKKLSFKEQRELEELPARIDQLETQIAELHSVLADPDFFIKQSGDVIARRQAELKSLQESLDHCFLRWSQLDG